MTAGVAGETETEYHNPLMCTTNVNAMPDSNTDGDAVKLTGRLADDDSGCFKMAHMMQVVPPSSYAEEEKRLAGLESDDNDEDEGCAAKKKKKKKKKNRKNVPLEGLLDAKHPKKNKKQTSNVNAQEVNGADVDVVDDKPSKKQKKQNGNVNAPEVNGTDDNVVSSHKPSKKRKRQDEGMNGLTTEIVDATVNTSHPKPKKQKKHDNVNEQNSSTTSPKSKKQKKHNNNVIEHVADDIDSKDFDLPKAQTENSKPKKQKKHANVNEHVADDVDSKDEKPIVLNDSAADSGKEDEKPAKKQKSQGDGIVYRQGMSLDEAIQAKHEAKKKSKTNKWRKNRPIEKGVTRRKSRLEEKLKQLKAKCEVLQARKNLGQSVMRQEKRLMSKERKLSSELGVISGSKKERKRKMLERRMTLAEGLRSPHGPAPILNSNGTPVKSKFDFSIFSMGNDISRSSNLRGRDYKSLLERVEKRQEEVDVMKEKDAERGQKLAEKMAWQTMMSRARGEKVKDDPKMLKQSMKKAEKLKNKRKKKWEERTAKVEESKDARQRKRQANLDKRKTDKLDKKKKKAIKKGRYIPGFG